MCPLCKPQISSPPLPAKTSFLVILPCISQDIISIIFNSSSDLNTIIFVVTITNTETMCSVQFSRSVVSNSLRPHESQHARPPCPSPTPGVYSNSCPSSQWCHPAISSSVAPFSSCPQSLPASGSFPMSQFFTWGSQNTGVSASASVLSMRYPLSKVRSSGCALLEQPWRDTPRLR